MTDEVRVTVRMAPAMKAALEGLALGQRRSLNATILTILDLVVEDGCPEPLFDEFARKSQGETK